VTAYSTAGFERRVLVVNGTRSVLYVAGSGPDVVYLHGGGTFHGFGFARTWTQRFRVLLPYHPGFGESADAPALAHLQDYVHHYRDLFDALELRRFHMVGASLGGRLAVEFAIAHEARVRRLALVAPAGLTDPHHPAPDFRAIPQIEQPAYLVEDLSTIRPFWPEEPDAAFWQARAREGATAGRLLRGAPEDSERLIQGLQRVRIPTLLIWGERDRMIPPQTASIWKTHLPHADVTLIPNAGHLLLDESAAACEAVAGFLER
jgi:pimeloyl-ACP methyl ester carboxylesterase